MFCQLEVLKHCLRLNVRQHLKQLPEGLDETYVRVLKEIHPANRDYARRVLQCLAIAFRPLHVDELAAILAFDPDAIGGEMPAFDADRQSDYQEEDLLSLCPGLISIVDSDGSRVVQFSHGRRHYKTSRVRDSRECLSPADS